MASDQGQTSRKLVYLRDHTPRPRPRAPRIDRKTPSPPPTELAVEATWLGRSLVVLAASVFLYWVALLSGVVRIEGDEAWRSAMSHSLPHVFLVAAASVAARALLRAEARAPLVVGLVSGALIVLALEGIASVAVGGALAHLSLNVRTDVLVRAATLAIGVWGASYSLRAGRRPGI